MPTVPSHFTAADPVTALKGVGLALAEKLARLGLYTVQDVLLHLPLRYQDRTRVVPMRALVAGREIVVEGNVVNTEVVLRRRRVLLVRLSDGSAEVMLRFFYFNRGQQTALKPGTKVRCFGEVRRSATGEFEMIHPEYTYASLAEAPMDTSLSPVYPTTEGVSQKVLRSLTDQVLAQSMLDLVPELLPTALLPPALRPVSDLASALQLVHRPPPDMLLETLNGGAHPAQRRLAFEELLAHHLSMQKMRRTIQSAPAKVLCVRPEVTSAYEASLRKQLSFTLTEAQERVLQEIKNDFAQPFPALRLIQGDVGSGKTVVAAIAALAAIDAGFQVAFMAPTELLAEQHEKNLTAWCTSLGINIGYLTGRLKGRNRKAMLTSIEAGEVSLVVGTHALLQPDVVFKSLALLIVDEQHRFGVHQRLTLREKGQQAGFAPHQLVMTATPIPRTLAMTAYADLDYSVIDALPPGRMPVKTVVLPQTRREEVIARIRRACQAGRQAYWVCTLIEESDVLQCQAAEEAAAQLHEQMPGIKIGLVHGRLKSGEKAEVMEAFAQGRLDLLVATTVIEVGVDVPNASLMIIENAERLGLAQLHQLRGRVGRGAVKSACVLLYKTLGARARKRLDIMRSTVDGFEIARRDLEIRGPGEVLGTRQTGVVDFRIADLNRDAVLLKDVHRLAKELLEADHSGVDALIQRWLGSAQKFSNV